MLCFVVLLWAFRRLTGSLPYALVGVLLVVAMSIAVHLRILRPQILGELAFATLLLALSKPVLSRRALVLIPVIFVLWANCHGSFPIGFILLGVFLAGRVLQIAWDAVRDARPGMGPWPWAVRTIRSVWGDAQTRRLGLVIVVALVAVAALNPHGPALFRYSSELRGTPTSRSWRSGSRCRPGARRATYRRLGPAALAAPAPEPGPVHSHAAPALARLRLGDAGARPLPGVVVHALRLGGRAAPARAGSAVLPGPARGPRAGQPAQDDPGGPGCVGAGGLVRAGPVAVFPARAARLTAGGERDALEGVAVPGRAVPQAPRAVAGGVHERDDGGLSAVGPAGRAAGAGLLLHACPPADAGALGWSA